MRVYLDNCAFNRPFDDQSQIRIIIETEAILFIQREVELGRIQLVWSYINESENRRNPSPEKMMSILKWKKIAVANVIETENILNNADDLVKLGLKAKDALHIASAVEGRADHFITTDDGILRKVGSFQGVEITSPTELIREIA